MRLRTGLCAALLVLSLKAPAHASTFDLTAAGANASIAAAIGGTFIVQQGSVTSETYEAFVRIQQNGSEQGYNTGNPGGFDVIAGIWTRPLPISEVPVVLINGQLYRQFFLDINESLGAEQNLSLNQIQIFDLTCDPASADVSVAATVMAISGCGAVEVFRMNNLPGDTSILLNAALSQGQVPDVFGDMFLYVLDSSFNGPKNNIILYSQFGTPPGSAPSGDGYEQWSVHRSSVCTLPGCGVSANPVPEPATVVLLSVGLVGLALFRRTRRGGTPSCGGA